MVPSHVGAAHRRARPGVGGARRRALRAARSGAGGGGRRLRRGALGARRRRDGRHLGAVPHRLRVEPARGHPEVDRSASSHRRPSDEAAMLNKIIEWSLRNQFLVVVALVFAVLGGVWAIRETRLDAIPDLSDVQVIIYTEYPGQAPQVVEDQVTYPITTKMLAVPYAKVVRGYSFFGYSFVYVIFEDGTDLYWARSRVLEYLSGLAAQLPSGVSPQLGPDATGVGWAFMYALNSPQRSLAELRSLPGLVPEVRPDLGRRRLRGRLDRRLRAPVPGRGRPGEAARLRHPAEQDQGGDPALEQRRRRPAGGDVASASTWSAGWATSRTSSDLEQVVLGGRARVARRSCCATSPTSPSAPRSAAASRTGTAKGRRWAASSSCAPAPTPSRRSPASRSALAELKAGLPDGRHDLGRPTTGPPSSTARSTPSRTP